MIRRGAIGTALAALLVMLMAGATPGRAQSVSPSGRRPSLTGGQVTGSVMQGGMLTVRIDAQMPGGWRGLHLVEASVLAGGSALEHMVFDIENNKLSLDDQDIAVGTGAVAEGEYLRVSGANVILTTGGGNLSLRINADVVRTIPDQARFDLSVTDDFGASVAVTRSLARPESGGGTTWETVIAFTAAALFIGGLIGNLLASRRRVPMRPSVYDTVRRRLDEERAGERSGS